MEGSTLEKFTAFWEVTKETILTGLDDFVNMQTREAYTMPRLIAGNVRDRMIAGGSYIRDRAFFKGNSTFRRINPDAKVSYINPQQGKDWVAPWSIAVAQTGWNLWEFDLNFDSMKETAQTHAFKRVRTGKKMDLYTDICNSMDDECWATPDFDAMEVTVNAAAPYSIPVFINEYLDGLPTDQGGSYSPWTTVQGINPAAADVDGKWAPTAISYDYDATPSAPNTTEIFSALTYAFLKTTFDQLPRHEKYSDKTTSPTCILTQTQGVVDYEHALRTNQDYFRGVGKQTGEDPAYMGPTFRNVPVQHITALDTAEIYPTGAADAVGAWNSTANSALGLTAPTSDPAGTVPGHPGPRYYGIKGGYITPFFHSDKYMELEKPFRLSAIGQHYNFVQLAKITNNLACRSRRDHFILYPKNGYVGASIGAL